MAKGAERILPHRDRALRSCAKNEAALAWGRNFAKLLLSEVLFMLIYKTFSVLYQNDIFFRFLIAQNAALRSYKNEVRKILMSIIFEIMILKTKLDFLIIFQ